MTETSRLSLPLLAASQAQKHVTVNEALARLDALCQLVVMSRSVGAPPVSPAEGDVYAVGPSASGNWLGQEGNLALFLNGGWEYLVPGDGWRAWVADEAVGAVYGSGNWWVSGIAPAASGAAMIARTAEEDHAVQAGATSVTAAIIPDGAVVVGVTGRVLSAIGGAASFRLGIGGVSDDRYGSGIGVAAGSWLRGVTGAPVAYYADTALTLTAEGGSFTGGTVRLSVHYFELTLPSAV